ncbi:MAG: restriction endonuclease [Planctomycetota bacterium]
MSDLAGVLRNIRQKIARYGGKQINEQNTKTALVDPVLRGLGWDVGDLEEVQQEYKRRPRDKPVDYALLVLRTPRLFVEAKALGQDLSDRRWANQIMGYATVAGVEWVVITDGNEYRIYNACAPVPVEEKLFRVVRVADDNAATQETLGLLSKERISENQIEILWKAHFVDRQVHAALDKLFSTEPDPSLMRLLKKHVKELPSKDVRASLRRVQAQFDFPVQPESPPTGTARTRSAAAKKAWTTRRAAADVSLSDLIDAGILPAPMKFVRNYMGQDLEAELRIDGTVVFAGNKYESPSAAASAAKRTVVGHPKSANGWAFWHFRSPKGDLVPLTAARDAYLKAKKS